MNWDSDLLRELAREQDELNRRQRARIAWVMVHGHPPPLSRWRRLRLLLRRRFRRPR